MRLGFRVIEGLGSGLYRVTLGSFIHKLACCCFTALGSICMPVLRGVLGRPVQRSRVVWRGGSARQKWGFLTQVFPIPAGAGDRLRDGGGGARWPQKRAGQVRTVSREYCTSSCCTQCRADVPCYLHPSCACVKSPFHCYRSTLRTLHKKVCQAAIQLLAASPPMSLQWHNVVGWLLPPRPHVGV